MSRRGIFIRGQGFERQGVDTGRKFLGKNGIDHPLALDPRLIGEGGGDHLDAEVAFAFRPGAGVANVAPRIVGNCEAPRRQRGVQFSFDDGGHAHDGFPLVHYADGTLPPTEWMVRSRNANVTRLILPAPRQGTIVET